MVWTGWEETGLGDRPPGGHTCASLTGTAAQSAEGFESCSIFRRDPAGTASPLCLCLAFLFLQAHSGEGQGFRSLPRGPASRPRAALSSAAARWRAAVSSSSRGRVQVCRIAILVPVVSLGHLPQPWGIQPFCRGCLSIHPDSPFGLDVRELKGLFLLRMVSLLTTEQSCILHYDNPGD